MKPDRLATRRFGVDRLTQAGDRYWVAALMLVGAAVRIYGLGSQSLWFDEAYSVFVAAADPGFALELIMADGVHPPLYYLVQRAGLWLGESEFLVRLPAVAFGLTSLPLVYALGARLSSRRAGLLAAGLMALSPYHVWYSREARMYSLLVLMALGVMYAYWKLLRTGGRSATVLLASVSAVAYLTHYFALYLPLIQFFHMVFRFKRHHPRLRAWSAAQLAAALPLGVWIALLAQESGRSFGIGWIPRPHLDDLAYTLMNFSVGYVKGLLPFAWILVGGFAALALQGARVRRPGTGLLVIWAVAPPLITYGLSHWRPVYVDRFLILSLPAVLLLVARGALALRPPWHLLTPAALLVATGYGMATFVFTAEQQKEQWRAAAHSLTELSADDAIVLRRLQMVVPLTYYWQGVEKAEVMEVNRQVTPISELAAGESQLGILIWHPSTDAHSVAAPRQFDPNTDPDPELRQWLLGRGPTILEQEQFAGLVWYRFRLDEAGQP